MPDFDVLNFSGGINNEIDSTLLPANVSVDLLNAEVLTGALLPLTEKKLTVDPNYPRLTHQTGNRSIVRFGNHYFWSDNTTETLSSTLGYFGLTPPSTLPVPKLLRRGNRFQGRYLYRFRFVTDDGGTSSASLPGEPGILTVEAESEEVVLQKADVALYTAENFLGRTKGKRYFGYGEGSIVNHNNLTWQLTTGLRFRGIHIPTDYSPGGKLGLWKDITTRSIVASGVDAIDLTQFPQSNQSGVTGIQIERTLVNGNVFYIVDVVDINQSSYTDVRSDGELIFNNQVEDREYFAPIYEERNGQFVLVGGKYLSEVNERYLLAVGTKVYESKQGDPHSWNPVSYLNFDGTVTGIAPIGDGYVVFIGGGQPYFVSGSIEARDVIKERFDTTVGLVNWKTIAHVNGTPVWLSHEGLAGIERLPQGQGKRIQILTLGRYTFDTDAEFALAHGAEYFLFYADGAVIVDFRRNHIHRSSLTADYGYYSNEDGKLYLKENQNFYEHEGGSGLTITYKSPRFTLGNPWRQKAFKKIKFFAESDVTCSIRYDGVEIRSDVLIAKTVSEVMEMLLPHETAYTIEVEVVTTGIFRGYRIEYEEVS